MGKQGETETRRGDVVAGMVALREVTKPGQRSRVRERPAFTFSPVTERLKVVPNYPEPIPDGVVLSDSRTRPRKSFFQSTRVHPLLSTVSACQIEEFLSRRQCWIYK